MSLLDDYFSTFGMGMQLPKPTLPAMNMEPVPVARPVAPQQIAVAAPAAPQQNPLDIIKALTGLVRRDPLGETARRNSQSNQMHSMDEWRAMFAPVHPQRQYTPEERMAALTNLRGQSGAQHLNIGGGRIVPEPDQVRTNLDPTIQRWTNPDGSVDIMYPTSPGMPAATGRMSGSVSYPSQIPVPVPVPAPVSTPALTPTSVGPSPATAHNDINSGGTWTTATPATAHNDILGLWDNPAPLVASLSPMDVPGYYPGVPTTPEAATAPPPQATSFALPIVAETAPPPQARTPGLPAQNDQDFLSWVNSMSDPGPTPFAATVAPPQSERPGSAVSPRPPGPEATRIPPMIVPGYRNAVPNQSAARPMTTMPQTLADLFAFFAR